MNVPPHIVEACNALLAPYGESYTPSAQSSGYLSPKDAAAYLGVSRSFFWRLVQAGDLTLIEVTPGARGKRVIARSALDAFIASRAKRP